MSNVAYKTDVTTTSQTLADLGAGLTVGHIRWESGKQYILAEAGGAIPDGYVATPDISLTATASALVFTVTPAGDEVWLVNNTGTVTGGIAVCVEGTSGELMERTDSINCGVALATIAADAKGAMYFDCVPNNFVMQA
jgi:hypothetical protein